MSDERAHLQEGDADETDGHNDFQSRAKRCFCIFGTVFFILLLIAAVIVLALLLVVVGQQPARVVTSCGAVEGKFDAVNKVFSFKGIPYAAPPLSHLRWRPTEPLNNETCWKGVYYASEFKPPCIQFDVARNQVKGDEDCLYMNIYTPVVDPEVLLPVMVYIHGGFLQFGDGSTSGYAPDEKLTNKLKIVFVSIQYRLNAFGFMVSAALPGHGNYGLLDQIEALRWIRQNIAAFGGDPNQVTIFGGSSVWLLMMSPLAKGLFIRAWMSSGSTICNKTTEQAIIDNAWFLEKDQIKSKCGPNVTARCLQTISARTIVNALYPEWQIVPDVFDLPKKGHFLPSLAVIDGRVIPTDPYDLWHNKNKSLYSDVPFVLGNTAQEVDLSPAPGMDIKMWTRTDLQRRISKHLDTFGTDLTNTTLSLYPWDRDAEYVYTTLTSDLRVICSTEILAKQASEVLSSDVYRYVVDGFPSKPVYALNSRFESKYAFHGWDLLAFFSNLDDLFSHGPEQVDEDFSNLIQNEMVSFARTGKPSDRSWFLYPNVTALLSDSIMYTDAYHKKQCDFWISNNFLPYSWTN